MPNSESSRDILVGVIVPANVADLAIADGTERARALKRRTTPQKSVQEFVQGILENYPLLPTPTPTALESRPLVTVEDAAKVIIACLDPEHQKLIRELAKASSRPLASYVMSPILLAKENGQLGVMIGEWADKRALDTKSPMPTTSTCEYCHGSFVPMREGQRFCPPPPDESDSCGRKWNMDKIHQMRDNATKHMGVSPFAPKPSLRTVEHAAAMDAMNV